MEVVGKEREVGWGGGEGEGEGEGGEGDECREHRGERDFVSRLLGIVDRAQTAIRSESGDRTRPTCVDKVPSAIIELFDPKQILARTHCIYTHVYTYIVVLSTNIFIYK